MIGRRKLSKFLVYRLQLFREDDKPDVHEDVKKPEQQSDNLKAKFENENSVLEEELQMEDVELDVVKSM